MNRISDDIDDIRCLAKAQKQIRSHKSISNRIQKAKQDNLLPENMDIQYYYGSWKTYKYIIATCIIQLDIPNATFYSTVVGELSIIIKDMYDKKE